MHEPAPCIVLCIVSFAKSSLVRLIRMSEFRIKKNLCQIAGTLEALVQSIQTRQDLNIVRSTVRNSYIAAMWDTIPKIIVCSDSGLTSSVCCRFCCPLGLDNLANNSSTDFPVSEAEDRPLLANTSGDTSMNIWFVASKRRMRAGNINKDLHIASDENDVHN